MSVTDIADIISTIEEGVADRSIKPITPVASTKAASLKSKRTHSSSKRTHSSSKRTHSSSKRSVHLKHDSPIRSVHSSECIELINKYYEENRATPWYDWLEIKEVFPKSGKQGLVGVMRVKERPELEIVFKISQYTDYLVQHELSVMNSLNQLSAICPHFCRSIGGILCEVDPTSRKEGNPFVFNSQHVIEKEVLLMEYLKNARKLSSYIYSSSTNETVIHSAVKQVLLAIDIAQRKVQFTHYDLHSNNILMKKCDPDVVFLYVIDENNKFCVPTHGYYPVIIDYGYSFASGMNENPLWASLDHTNIGFFSDRYDSVADPRLFLITVSDEMKHERKTSLSKQLRNIAKNLYSSLNVDWESGWYEDIIESAANHLLTILEPMMAAKKSPLFKKYSQYCVEIMQSLIVLPLENQANDNLELSFTAFMDEFVKIENEISSPFYCLYILKGIVDAARVTSVDYCSKTNRNHTVQYFKTAVQERIDSVVKYCKLKEINYEKMLCSLLCLAREMEGVLYRNIDKVYAKKLAAYRKLPLQSVTEISKLLEVNVDDEYVFNKDSVVVVINATERHGLNKFSLDENEIRLLNECEPRDRSSVLYEVYEKNQN